MRAEAMAAYTRSLLEPLVQTIERQAGEIAELREDRGRLTAENAALKASQTPQDANPGLVVPVTTTNAPIPLLARLRALAPWLIAVLAIVAVVVLLAWPR